MLTAKKQVRNTNITVKYTAAVDTQSPAHLLSQIRLDDSAEVEWSIRQRPLQNMTHPAEAFNEGIKTLKPAVMFNTYDEGKAKVRRLHNQKMQLKRTEAYRSKRVRPSHALKALGDRKKLVVRSKGDEFSTDPVLKRLPARKSKGNPNKKALAKDLNSFEASEKKGSSKGKAPKTAIGKAL